LRSAGGDKLFYFTTCGWMMWNWLVSGLAVGATLCLFDGSPFHRLMAMCCSTMPGRKIRHLRHLGKIYRCRAQERLDAGPHMISQACG
jgi:acyl-coenzyme A synthetase/AMP-(fatty) acid ligase